MIEQSQILKSLFQRRTPKAHLFAFCKIHIVVLDVWDSRQFYTTCRCGIPVGLIPNRVGSIPDQPPSCFFRKVTTSVPKAKDVFNYFFVGKRLVIFCQKAIYCLFPHFRLCSSSGEPGLFSLICFLGSNIELFLVEWIWVNTCQHIQFSVRQIFRSFLHLPQCLTVWSIGQVIVTDHWSGHGY